MRSSLYDLYTNYPLDDYCEKNYSGNILCRNFLLALQDSILLATQKWQNLAIALNKKCRCKFLQEEEVQKDWGNKPKLNSIDKFSDVYLSERKSKQKRFAVLAVVGGIFLFSVFMSLVSYGISEAVTSREVENIKEEIIAVENFTLSALNSTDIILENLDERLSLIEQFMQIQAFALQSGQEAENLLLSLTPRIFNNNNEHDIAHLQFDFQEDLMDQIVKDNAKINVNPEELLIKLYKLKRSTTFISWLKTQQDYKCESSSVITMMVSINHEEDQNMYAREEETGAMFSNEQNDNKLFFTNQFSLKLFQENLDHKLYGFNSIVLANRRMVTTADTYLVFSDGNKMTYDRITVFFHKNETERKAEIKCPNDVPDIHIFTTGTTIDLPLYCSVISAWWNATGISIYSENKENNKLKSFSMKWKPVNVRANLSNHFQDIRETVKNFVKIRDEAFRNKSNVPIQTMFDTLNSLVTSSSGLFEFISDNKESAGAVGSISMVGLLLILYRTYFYLKRKSVNKNTSSEYELSSHNQIKKNNPLFLNVSFEDSE